MGFLMAESHRPFPRGEAVRFSRAGLRRPVSRGAVPPVLFPPPVFNSAESFLPSRPPPNRPPPSRSSPSRPPPSRSSPSRPPPSQPPLSRGSPASSSQSG